MLKHIYTGLSILVLALILSSCSSSDDNSEGTTTEGTTTEGATTEGATTEGATTEGTTTEGTTTEGTTTEGTTTEGTTTEGSTTEGGTFSADFCGSDASDRADSDPCSYVGFVSIVKSPQAADIQATAIVVDSESNIVGLSQNLVNGVNAFPANQCDRYVEVPASLDDLSINEFATATQSGSTVSVGGPLVIQDATQNQIGILNENTQSVGGTTFTIYSGTVIRGNVNQSIIIPGNPALGIAAHEVSFGFAPELSMTSGSIQSVDQISQPRQWSVNYNEADLPAGVLTNIVQWITTVDQQDGVTVNYNCRGIDDGAETPVFDINPNDTDTITSHTSSREMITLTQVGNVLWFVYSLDVIN